MGVLIKLLQNEGANFSFAGLVNVESGDISVRALYYKKQFVENSSPFNPCEDCASVEENVLFFSCCDTCGRSDENYFWLHAGDGDGVYAVLDILKRDADGNIRTIGFAVDLRPSDEFSRELFEISMSESQFGYPIDILLDQHRLEAFEIVSFLVPKESGLYVSDKAAESDSADAMHMVVLFNEDPLRMKFLAFSEKAGEQLGAYPNEISPRPRILVALDETFLDKHNFEASMPRPEGAEVFRDWILTGISSSHMQDMGTSTAWFNFELNEALEKYNYAVSWLLQGAIHGESDCLSEMHRYEEKLSDLELVATLLRQRSQYEAARDVEKTGKLNFGNS